jgi:hypothetical protein
MQSPSDEQRKKRAPENPTLDQEFQIMIPLKGGRFKMQKQELSQEFLKAIQDEYATRFCEALGLEPNNRNKT